MNKLAIVHPAYWEQAMGGAELQLNYIADFAKSKGYEIHYIYEDKGKPIKNNNEFIMHPLKMIHLRRTFGLYFSFYKNSLFKNLKEINPDVIYTKGAYSWSGISANYAKTYSKKHIWAIANDNDPITNLEFHDILKPLNFLEKYWVRYGAKNASVIICQNRIQQKHLSDLHKRSGTLITQLGLKENREIKKDFTKIKILWVANLKPIKRPEIFIRLASFFNNKNIEFVMVGRPSAKYQLLLEKSTNINYLGELPNSEVDRLLCESHILINTSESEGFSNTYIQAWMRKVPVITMNSNPDKILTDQDIGKVCETEEKLILALKELISDIPLLQSMGDRAHKYAMENHNADDLLPKILQLFI